MATYSELRDLFTHDTLPNRVEIAVIKAAQALIDGTPTAPEQSWAASVLSNPSGEASKAFRYVLAANSASTVAVITAATDAQIQTNVDAAVPSLVVAFNAA